MHGLRDKTTCFCNPTLLTDCVILCSEPLSLHSLAYKAGMITVSIWGRNTVVCLPHGFFSLLGTKENPISYFLLASVWGPVTNSDHQNVGASSYATTGMTPQTSHRIFHALSPVSLSAGQLQKDPRDDSEEPIAVTASANHDVKSRLPTIQLTVT